ncbi:MAG TPA: hypothetical protein VMT17_19505 [Anaeromyxobacteraceae bacterium]|nr:hypothetical protein [Anaeromyxobacteraceae bacterium]
MYSIVLALHSLVRWAVVAGALSAAAVSATAWLSGRSATRASRVSGVAFVAAADAQVLLGLLLYFFFSPFAPAALAHPVASLTEAGFRYWFFLHPVPAIGSAFLAHLGRILSRRGEEGDARRRQLAAVYGAAVVLLAVAIPWPFLAFGRPLWPF